MAFPLRSRLEKVGEVCDAQSIEVGIVVADGFPPGAGMVPGYSLILVAIHPSVGYSYVGGILRHGKHMCA